MNRNTVAVLDFRLALNKGQEIIQCVGSNIVVLVVYPLNREFLFLVCDFSYVGGENFHTVGVVAHTAENHHLAAFAVKRRLYSRPADFLGLVYVGKGRNVRAALSSMERTLQPMFAAVTFSRYLPIPDRYL